MTPPIVLDVPGRLRSRLLRLGPSRIAVDEAARSAWRQIAIWWLVSRLVVFASAAAVQLLGWPKPGWHPSLFHHPFALLWTWDGRWYRIVAERGYLLIPGHQSDPAFFPLFPLLERVLHGFGAPFVAAGLVLANLGLLAGLLALYELGREILPEQDARRAACYAAVFPLGFVFSMAYPEGIALPALALSGLFALRERWLLCALCSAAAVLLRPEGIFLVIPIAVAVWRAWPHLSFPGRTRAAAAVLAGPLALASFSAYLWWALGNPLAWSTAERAWGRAFSPSGFYAAGVQLLAAGKDHNHWLYKDAVAFLLYVVLLVLAVRARVHWSWVIGGALIVLLPVASGSLASDSRFGLLALPVFWGLAVLGRRVWLDRALLVVCPLLLAAAVFSIPLRFP